MNLDCKPELGSHLKSSSQKARVISEAWLTESGYCLNCVSEQLLPTIAGTIARDYVCPKCGCAYELKSSARAHTRMVRDGGYEAMMRRLRGGQAPALMLMHYTTEWRVQGLIAVHPVFLTPAVIVKRRKPHLRPRTGVAYQMCDLDLSMIPPDGKITVVSDNKPRPYPETRRNFRESARFGNVPLGQRGWAALVLSAVRKIGKTEFTLADVYLHEAAMHCAYPENSHIREKIRQQLQVLRDLQYIEFLSRRGEYRVLSSY